MGSIVSIWLLDAELGESIANLAWVADGPSKDEADDLAWFADELAAESVDVAKSVVGYDWFTDGLTRREISLLESLVLPARHSPELASQAASLSWIGDGISELESDTLSNLFRMADIDTGLAARMLGYQWVGDNHVTWGDQEMIAGLVSIAKRDLDLGKMVNAMLWIAELTEVAGYQMTQITYLGYILDRDPALAWELARFLSTGASPNECGHD